MKSKDSLPKGGMSSSLFALPFLALLVICSSAFASQAQPSPPKKALASDAPKRLVSFFKKGDTFAAWRLDERIRHKEYLRLVLKKGRQRTTLEIVRRNLQDEHWVTEHYRLQPMPEQMPPEPLMKAVFARLVLADEALGGVKLRKPKGQREEERTRGAVYFALSFFALFLWAALLFSFLRYRQGARDKKAKRQAFKVFGFGMLTSLPAWLLAYFLLETIRTFFALSHFVDIDEEIVKLEKKLSIKKGVRFRAVEEGGRHGFLDDQGDTHFLPNAEGKTLIHALGGSSLVVGHEGGLAFPDALERCFHEAGQRDVTLVNLGVAGYDSYSLLNRAEGLLELAPPDILLIYTGHNDYTNQYVRFVRPVISPFEHSPALKGFMYVYYRTLFSTESPLMTNAAGAEAFRHALRFHIAPPLLAYAAQRGALAIDTHYFEKADALILSHFQKNIQSLLAIAERRGVAVLLVPPIGNLEMRPYPAKTKGARLYRDGMRQKRHHARLSALQKARDLDRFNGDIRAKTPLAAWLKSLKGERLYLFDLEKALLDGGYRLGYDLFHDAFHFRKQAHESIAKALYRFIESREILDEVRKKEDEPKRENKLIPQRD